MNTNVRINGAGKGLQIKEGTNARLGGETLVAGTATIANASVTTATRVLITRTSGTSTGQLRVTKTAGTGSTAEHRRGATPGRSTCPARIVD